MLPCSVRLKENSFGYMLCKKCDMHEYIYFLIIHVHFKHHFTLRRNIFFSVRTKYATNKLKKEG